MKNSLFLFAGVIAVFLLQNCKSTNAPSTYHLTISVIPSEGGTVTPSSGDYEAGTQLEITAKPSDGWRFEQWEGDYQSSNSTTTITVDYDMSIQAKFVKREYPLTIEIEGEGTVEETVIKSKSTDYEHGSKVELTAKPADGWRFEEWEGDLEGSTNPESITVDNVKTVKAVFREIEYKEIGVSYEATDGLTVTLNSLRVTNHETYYEYYISYNLKNNTDRIINESGFKMYYKDVEGGEPQYGLFGKLTPNEEKSRSYSWQIEKSEPIFGVLEYHEDNFFSKVPLENSLKWKVDI